MPLDGNRTERKLVSDCTSYDSTFTPNGQVKELIDHRRRNLGPLTKKMFIEELSSGEKCDAKTLRHPSQRKP